MTALDAPQKMDVRKSWLRMGFSPQFHASTVSSNTEEVRNTMTGRILLVDMASVRLFADGMFGTLTDLLFKRPVLNPENFDWYRIVVPQFSDQRFGHELMDRKGSWE